MKKKITPFSDTNKCLFKWNFFADHLDLDYRTFTHYVKNNYNIDVYVNHREITNFFHKPIEIPIKLQEKRRTTKKEEVIIV